MAADQVAAAELGLARGGEHLAHEDRLEALRRGGEPGALAIGCLRGERGRGEA